jgi:2'-5' RNA ligase
MCEKTPPGRDALRLFFAIKVERTDAIDELVSQLEDMGRGLKPIRQGNQHITLKFLGDPGVALEDVKSQARDLEGFISPFELKVSHPGAFPNWKRPSVLWIGFEGDKILEVASNLDRKLHEKIGSPMEKREFRSHLTIARTRGKFDISRARKLMEISVERLRSELPVIEVNGFQLISSTLTPDGPIYETVEEFEFKHNDI